MLMQRPFVIISHLGWRVHPHHLKSRASILCLSAPSLDSPANTVSMCTSMHKKQCLVTTCGLLAPTAQSGWHASRRLGALSQRDSSTPTLLEAQSLSTMCWPLHTLTGC